MRVEDAACRSATYRRGTANMLVGPAASHSSGDAVESISAACSGRVDLDWVPELEDLVVPDEQLRLCLSCPARAACLQAAVSTQSEGYWGGTTTADRRRLVPGGPVTPAAADELRREVTAARAQQLTADEVEALHAPGLGNMTWYGHGCRCGECRRANADKRARQRRRQSSAAAAGERRWDAA